MKVYLLWTDSPDPEESENILEAVFSSYELAQSYADNNLLCWYTIEEVIVDEVTE